MHSNDKHFLIIGTIEDADPTAFGKAERRTPEKIMFQFLGARLLETVNITSLRIDPDMTCRMAPSLPAESIP